MDLFQAMRVYVKVVEAGSLTAAAQACSISTTMVGNHLRALKSAWASACCSAPHAVSD